MLRKYCLNPALLWGTAEKPTEGTRAPRQKPSVGHISKGVWVAKAIAGGELWYSLSAKLYLSVGDEELI
jgi:hypothetical protein